MMVNTDTQIGTGLPEMTLGDGAQQRFLHEIVGAFGVAGQHPRITPKPRDLPLHKPMKLAHSFFPEVIATKSVGLVLSLMPGCSASAAGNGVDLPPAA